MIIKGQFSVVLHKNIRCGCSYILEEKFSHGMAPVMVGLADV